MVVFFSENNPFFSYTRYYSKQDIKKESGVCFKIVTKMIGYPTGEIMRKAYIMISLVRVNKPTIPSGLGEILRSRLDKFPTNDRV